MNALYWLETHQLPCFYKSRLGMDCPGCGSQTAFIHLLKGDLGQAFTSYPPLLMFVSLFVFIGFHLALRFRNGGTFLKYFFVLTILSVAVNFIYRQIVQV